MCDNIRQPSDNSHLNIFIRTICAKTPEVYTWGTRHCTIVRNRNNKNNKNIFFCHSHLVHPTTQCARIYVYQTLGQHIYICSRIWVLYASYAMRVMRESEILSCAQATTRGAARHNVRSNNICIYIYTLSLKPSGASWGVFALQSQVKYHASETYAKLCTERKKPHS